MNSNKSIIRIVQDIYDFNKNKPEGIYLSINKNNLMKQHALIIAHPFAPCDPTKPKISLCLAHMRHLNANHHSKLCNIFRTIWRHANILPKIEL